MVSALLDRIRQRNRQQQEELVPPSVDSAYEEFLRRKESGRLYEMPTYDAADLARMFNEDLGEEAFATCP